MIQTRKPQRLWKDPFVGSAAELQRKTPALYQLRSSEFRSRLRQGQDLIAFQNRHAAFLDQSMFVGMSADCSGLYNLTTSIFFNISMSTRVQAHWVCPPI